MDCSFLSILILRYILRLSPLRATTQLKLPRLMVGCASHMPTRECKNLFTACICECMYACFQHSDVGLHQEGDGLLRYEAYWCFNSLINDPELPDFTFDEVNRRIRNAPAEVWSDGQRLPDMHLSIKKGAKGNKPRANGVMKYTGSQMHKFALARYHTAKPELLAPILTLAYCFGIAVRICSTILYPLITSTGAVGRHTWHT